MNRKLAYHGDERRQIEMLAGLGVFAASEKVESLESEQLEHFPEWGFGNFDRGNPGESQNTLEPPDGDAERLARAWLEVNCAMCHRPDGISPRKRDMRYHTPLAKMNLVNQPPEHGRMTPPAGRLIKPGEPYLSELLIRAGHRGTRQMPPLATNLVNDRGLAILRRWIEELAHRRR